MKLKIVSYGINRNNQRLWITLHPYQNCNVTFSVLQKETDLFVQVTFESKSVCWAVKQVDLVFVECIWLAIAKVTAPPSESLSVYFSSNECKIQSFIRQRTCFCQIHQCHVRSSLPCLENDCVFSRDAVLKWLISDR